MVNFQRIHPLSELLYAGNKVLIQPEPARTRISLRTNPDAIEQVNKIIGIDLPTSPKTSTLSDTRSALWLGPDEWILIDNLESNLSDTLVQLENAPCSAVDISHRNTAITLTGASAANVINSGCPQDLSANSFPVGACSRTILGKSEIILLRTAENVFHLECWRSFSEYVWKFLVDSAKKV